MGKTKVTKFQYKLIVWGSIIIGLIFNAIFYSILTNNKIGNDNLVYVGLLALSCITIGFGCGLAYAYSFEFTD